MSQLVLTFWLRNERNEVGIDTVNQVVEAFRIFVQLLDRCINFTLILILSKFKILSVTATATAIAYGSHFMF